MKTIISICIGAVLYASIIGTSFSSLENNDELLIIPRASWGANAEYNNRNGIYWEQILKNREEVNKIPISEEKSTQIKETNRKIENYLYGNFLDQFTSKETLYSKDSGTYKYAWPIKYTNEVNSIVIHHTHSSYDNSLVGVRDIHRFHSLSRQWGDIGYHYIIGDDGEIFEGREGGDYVVGAHSKYNNFGSVGIAIIGDYHDEGINSKQYASLEKLVQVLIEKYGIDLSKQRYYHRSCKGDKCNTLPIETYRDSVLIGHRDATHTSCPGDELYEQVQKIRSDNLEFSKGRVPVLKSGPAENKLTGNTAQIQVLIKAVRKYSLEQRKTLIDVIDKKKAQTNDRDRIKKLQTLRLAIILSQKEN